MCALGTHTTARGLCVGWCIVSVPDVVVVVIVITGCTITKHGPEGTCSARVDSLGGTVQLLHAALLF